MILYGDKEEHEPCWFTNDPDDAPPEDKMEVEDDDPYPSRPMKFYKEFGICADPRTPSTTDVRGVRRKESSEHIHLCRLQVSKSN